MSALQAITYLVGSNAELKDSLIGNCEDKLKELINHFLIEAGPNHTTILPSLLWSLVALDQHKDDQSMALFDKSLKIISDHVGEKKHLSFPSSVLLNQVLNELESSGSEPRKYGFDHE